MLAPAVSMPYWGRLLQQRADAAAAAGAPLAEVLPMYIAGGRGAALVDLLVASGELCLAADVASVQATGCAAGSTVASGGGWCSLVLTGVLWYRKKHGQLCPPLCTT
jgi:hypothetical protein